MDFGAGDRPPPAGHANRGRAPIVVSLFWREVRDTAARLLRELTGSSRPLSPVASAATTPAPRPLRPLARLRLTDEVNRTLFAEYAAHRDTPRGEEETGWAVLGLRDGEEAVALATLPAGAEREAGEAHVRFNSAAQALASRIVRQKIGRASCRGRGESAVVAE